MAKTTPVATIHARTRDATRTALGIRCNFTFMIRPVVKSIAVD
jgi:hypothetical protein